MRSFFSVDCSTRRFVGSVMIFSIEMLIIPVV